MTPATISVPALFALLGTHYLADFILQTDWQAKNKYHDLDALLRHVTVYTICLMAIFSTFVDPGTAWLFGAVTWGCHAGTDAVTSRVSHALAVKEDWHDFFVVIGLDQLLHAVQLVLTFVWLTR